MATKPASVHLALIDLPNQKCLFDNLLLRFNTFWPVYKVLASSKK